MGDLYRALGEGDSARTAYESSLSIRQMLAEAEPDRADYQRDLSVSYDKMGDLYLALGEGDSARSAYESSLSIRQKLAEAEPDRADYQRDLAASLERIGDVSQEVDDAHRAFDVALSIRERLAVADENRSGYQVELMVPLTRLAALEGRDGIPRVERAIAILEELKSQGRLSVADEPRLEACQQILESMQKL